VLVLQLDSWSWAVGMAVSFIELGCWVVSGNHAAGLLGCQSNSWSWAVGIAVSFIELGCWVVSGNHAAGLL
jgi:hypothetical protein